MKRILVAAAIIVMLGAISFAQRGPRSGNPISALKNAVDLTDAQVTSITALFQTERTRMQAIRTELQQRREAMDALLNAASPVPVDVGNAAIALHTSEAKSQAELLSMERDGLWHIADVLNGVAQCGAHRNSD